MICSSCWFSVWDPIRVALAFVPIAPSSGRAGQRVVARRTVLTGLVMAVLLTVAGGAIARAYAPRVENALIGIGLVLIVVTLTSIARHPASLFDKSTSIEPKAIAITPLAVPGMINPVGVSLIFAEATHVHDPGAPLIFLGIVVGILAVNHVVLLAIPLLIRNVAVPVLVVIQEIFSLLPVTLGARMVPTGLKGYGVISLH